METSCAFSSKRAWHCLLGVVASQAKRSPGPASEVSMTDWILRGGEAVGGSGRPRRRADVAIAGDLIAAVGVVGKVAGAREIDVTGKIVAPGFIDVHTHDDRALLATPDMAAKASQGVTTVVTGNCGVSLAPLVLEGAPPPPLDLIGDAANYHYARFADYLAALDRAPAVPVVISHHKTIGRENFGRTAETLPVIAAAIALQEVGLDAYPYIASSTVLSAAQAERALKVLVTWSKSAPEEAGRELAAIAADWGVSQKKAVDRLQPAGAVYWMMDEADVQRVLQFEHTVIGSDGLPHDTHPHPRLWAAFPRVLGYYSRELGLFSLEEAVRRMTGHSAYRFGLAGRGILAAGGYADVTVFDPDTDADRATYVSPTTPAAGIEHVFVNGRPVWCHGQPTGERPGRALRRQQMQGEARGFQTP